MTAGPYTAGVLSLRSATEFYREARLNTGAAFDMRITQTGAIDMPERVANVQRLISCWNTLHGLTLPQIERLGALLDKYNGDEVEDLLTESGV